MPIEKFPNPLKRTIMNIRPVQTLCGGVIVHGAIVVLSKRSQGTVPIFAARRTSLCERGFAAKMGLSPLRRGRGQVRVFGQHRSAECVFQPKNGPVPNRSVNGYRPDRRMTRTLSEHEWLRGGGHLKPLAFVAMVPEFAIGTVAAVGMGNCWEWETVSPAGKPPAKKLSSYRPPSPPAPLPRAGEGSSETASKGARRQSPQSVSAGVL